MCWNGGHAGPESLSIFTNIMSKYSSLCLFQAIGMLSAWLFILWAVYFYRAVLI